MLVVSVFVFMLVLLGFGSNALAPNIRKSADMDLDELIALSQAPAGRRRRKPRADEVDAVAVVAAPAPAALDGVDADLLAVVALAEPAARRHERRSWQLLEKARAAKQQKRLSEQVEEESVGRRLAEHLVRAVVMEHPIVARGLGLKMSPTEMNDARARLTMRLAFAPVVCSSPAGILRQNRAAFLTSRCALADQVRCVSEYSMPPEQSADLLQLDLRTPRIQVFEWGCRGQ